MELWPQLFNQIAPGNHLGNGTAPESGEIQEKQASHIHGGEGRVGFRVVWAWAWCSPSDEEDDLPMLTLDQANGEAGFTNISPHGTACLVRGRF